MPQFRQTELQQISSMIFDYLSMPMSGLNKAVLVSLAENRRNIMKQHKGRK